MQLSPRRGRHGRDGVVIIFAVPVIAIVVNAIPVCGYAYSIYFNSETNNMDIKGY